MISRYAAFMAAMIGCSQTMAADLPSRKTAPPAPQVRLSFEGFYAGVHAGFQHNDQHWTMQGFGVTPSTSVYNLDLDGSGSVFGVHAGYNHVSGNLIYGIETDLDRHGHSKYKDVSLKSSEVDFNWQSSLRLRGGYNFDRLYVYATGGLAFADISRKTGCVPNYDWCDPAEKTGNLSDLRIGWTAGVGLEWLLNRSWSMRAEYRYSDFGKSKADTSDFWSRLEENPRNYSDTMSTTSQRAIIGLTYIFDKR